MSTPNKLLSVAGAAGSGPEPILPDFSDNILLLDGDGINGDDNRSFTCQSGTSIYTSSSLPQGSFSPYGDNWSNYFTGSGYLTVPNFRFRTNNFTIEAWVYFEDAAATQNPIIVLGNDGYNDWQLDTSSSNIRFQYSGGSVSGSTTLQSTAWYHVAVVRSSTGAGGLKIYLNGELEATATVSEDFDGTGNIKIGQNRGSNYYLDGYMSNVRLVSGSAVYTSAFTPSTSPLTAISGTQLLTCSSNGFKDEGPNTRTITPAINSSGGDWPRVTPFSPFHDSDARTLSNDGGSVFIPDASGRYLYFSEQLYTTTSFTIEGWVYMTDTPVSGASISGFYCSNHTLSNVNYGPSFGPGSNRKLSMRWWLGYGATAEGSTVLNLFEWYHIACSVSGGTIRMFVNGQRESVSGSSYSSPIGTSSYGSIGQNSYGRIKGYISDIKVSTTSRYYSNFTPPTSPVSSGTTGQTLFLDFKDAGVFDRTGINNFFTHSSFQISNTKKYGTGSMNVNSDYAYAYNVPTLGTGDFTVETWVYFQGDPTSGFGLFQFSNGVLNNQDGRGPAIGTYSGSGKWHIYYGASSAYGTSTVGSAIAAPSRYTWYHVAYVRTAGVIKIFIDGTQIGSDISYAGDYQDTILTVGGWYSTGYTLNGRLDDFRITKMARYTANFTPPAQALTKF